MFCNLDKTPPATSTDIIPSHSNYFEKKETKLEVINETEDDDYDVHQIEDVTHEFEDETLSLESKEKELIIKALKKHRNKRKYAAQDLGISERTLYRQIKQYELQ